MNHGIIRSALAGRVPLELDYREPSTASIDILREEYEGDEKLLLQHLESLSGEFEELLSFV
jgi:hypothetical protein